MKELIQKLKIALHGPDFEIEPLKNGLISASSKELVTEILNTEEFISPKISYLFLVLPEIWKDFQLDDWLYIIRNVKRPKKYRIGFDYSPCFEDITFLYNWIGIDSLDLYQKDTQISKENKANLDNIYPGYLSFTSRKDWSIEDFEDGTYGNIEYFREMKKRLIKQGAKPSTQPDL